MYIFSASIITFMLAMCYYVYELTSIEDARTIIYILCTLTSILAILGYKLATYVDYLVDRVREDEKYGR